MRSLAPLGTTANSTAKSVGLALLLLLSAAPALHASAQGEPGFAARQETGPPTVQASAQGEAGLSASLDPGGRFEIRATDPAWVFGGSLGHPVSGLATTTGQDALGSFDEVSFQAADAARRGTIRTYPASGIVLFSLTYTSPTTEAEPFPVLGTRPNLPFNQSYRSVPFSPAQFNGSHVNSNLSEAADSPWLFFDANAQAYLLSAADNVLLARTSIGQDGTVAVGLDPGVGALPAGFTQRALLVVGHGIHHVYQAWGQALTTLHNKPRPPNDANVTLSRLGYWTDNGATYYYRQEPSLGYAETLLAVKAAFDRDHLPLGYMQLDSWWYPKGAGARWDDGRGGIYLYAPAPELFGEGLGAFQRRLGLPLMTHARWIDPASPYRSTYAMSGNVVTDPRYWDDRLAALASAGVVAYEQDWLGAQAQPAYNLSDPRQFLDNMAAAAATNGLSLQYCMPLPRHYLQSALYSNVTSIRVSDDRFERGKWDAALYDAQLASALGVWPWDDVFLSSERDNLLLATLSAGVVGVGDPVGKQDADNLRQVMRADGVLVKPDEPLVPTDATYVAEAQGLQPPMVAAAATQHGALRYLYVFAYARGGASQTASFTPAALGLPGPAYVYAADTGSGSLVETGAAYTASLAGTASASAYFVVAPLGPSGLAFLGDAGRFVPLGRSRVSQLEDSADVNANGVLRATIEVADGEGPLTLRGYAPQPPRIAAEGGSVAGLAYDAASGLFTFTLAADAGQPNVRLTIALP